MMRLFVGTNVAMGSGPEAAFILGMRNAFAVSVALCAVAAGFSLVRGPETDVSPSDDRNPWHASYEDQRQQRRRVIGKEIAREYRVERQGFLGRQDEDVSKEPDAQDPERERHRSAPESDKGALYGHAQAESDDRIGIDMESPIGDREHVRLPGEEQGQAGG